MHARREILEWAEQGRIAAAGLRRALELAEVLPGAAEWRGFLDRLLLFLGAVLLGAGILFFFAFNWNELGRFGKFALAQAPIVAALAVLWKLGLDRPGGKAALLVAALATGALFALIGQTYQTGADTFELFAVWAAATLPWALVGHFAALWVLWLVLVNVAASLYFHTFPGVFGVLFGPEPLAWLLFALNGAALVAWEAAARRLDWARGRWAPRLVALAAGVPVTALAVMALLEGSRTSGWAIPAWLAWTGVLYVAYRLAVKDLFMLAGGALSVIVVATTLLARGLSFRDGGAFLVLALAVIGLSAAAGFWLRGVAKDFEE